ncbi:MAG: aminotransferase class III-fold pyridoxal phosphate-dependent enzyme [Ignavibacteria bacterium]|nr:aminotransferase class III-fold pyridoxal phosphate-dependent enzyme [Ignavibacteria bacterium]
MNIFDVYPLFNITPVRALGSRVWDEKGQEYLDLYGGHAVISIGHSHPHYVQVISEQLSRMGFYSNSVQIPQQQVLANLLGKLSGYDDFSLFLCNSGAEANENAFKLASFHTGRTQIISFKKSFHGRTSLAVAATDDPKIIAPVNENPNITFLPLNDIDALVNAMNDNTSAVICEGIQGVGGINVPTPEFLQAVRQECDKHGAILILDEVQSGYGRSGKFFAHQHSGITPDIITIAKGMGNGFPVAGVMIHPKFTAKHGMLGTTFGGNYLACAASIAVLEVLESEHLILNAATVGNYLMSELQTVPGVRQVRGQGLMIGIELTIPCAPIRSKLLYEYHIFTGSSSEAHTIRLLPSLALSKEDADEFLAAFRDVMGAV